MHPDGDVIRLTRAAEPRSRHLKASAARRVRGPGDGARHRRHGRHDGDGAGGLAARLSRPVTRTPAASRRAVSANRYNAADAAALPLALTGHKHLPIPAGQAWYVIGRGRVERPAVGGGLREVGEHQVPAERRVALV
ncbi:hypothetical protein WEI85_33620 [Actinomycetes bacterium KLBMP 9797]